MTSCFNWELNNSGIQSSHGFTLPSLLSPPLNKDRLKLRAFVYVVLGTAEGQKQPLRKTNHLPPYWTQTMPLVAHRKKRRGTVMCFEMFFVLIIFHCCDWAQWKQEFPPTPPALNPGRCRRSAENTLGYLTVISQEPVVQTHAASPHPHRLHWCPTEPHPAPGASSSCCFGEPLKQWAAKYSSKWLLIHLELLMLPQKCVITSTLSAESFIPS